MPNIIKSRDLDIICWDNAESATLEKVCLDLRIRATMVDDIKDLTEYLGTAWQMPDAILIMDDALETGDDTKRLYQQEARSFATDPDIESAQRRIDLRREFWCEAMGHTKFGKLYKALDNEISGFDGVPIIVVNAHKNNIALYMEMGVRVCAPYIEHDLAAQNHDEEWKAYRQHVGDALMYLQGAEELDNQSPATNRFNDERSMQLL